jgi:hypothetical protein
MDSFYVVIDKLKELLEASEFNNKVTFGDITEIDLDKMTTFPLAHIIVDRVSFEDKMINYEVKLIVCDVVDIIKEDIGDDFYLNNNVQDILNTQLQVINLLVAYLRRLDKTVNGFMEVNGTVSCDAFVDRFENMLAGWETTMTITQFNGIGIC